MCGVNWWASWTLPKNRNCGSVGDGLSEGLREGTCLNLCSCRLKLRRGKDLGSAEGRPGSQGDSCMVKIVTRSWLGLRHREHGKVKAAWLIDI